MAGYTEGPWIATSTDFQPPGYPMGVIHFAESKVDEVIAPNISSEANARLIAAAPDLYEALKGMEDWALQQMANALVNDDADVITSDRAHAILSALTKAEGDPQ